MRLLLVPFLVSWLPVVAQPSAVSQGKEHAGAKVFPGSGLRGLKAKHPGTDDELDKGGKDGGNDASDGKTVETIIEDDLVRKLIHPHRLMPFYMLPISAGFKVLLQFMAIGSDLKMKPQKPKLQWYDVLKTWFSHICGTLPFILLALNTWKMDWEDIVDVGKNIPRESDGVWTRALVRMVIIVTSSNFVAAVALWSSTLAQSPAYSLDLAPKYVSLPLLKGFPLNPFGTSWLKPLKWTYAMILAPYAIWALPGYLLILGLQSCVNCTLCCCHGCCGCCCYIWNVIKAEICCCFGCCKCCFWTSMGAVSLGFWTYAREEAGSYWPYIWAFGYLVILVLWTNFAPNIFLAIYGLFIGADLKDIIKSTQSGVLTPQSGQYTQIQEITQAPNHGQSPPVQLAMSMIDYDNVPKAQKMQYTVDAYLATFCITCVPQVVVVKPFPTQLRDVLIKYNAAQLNEDFLNVELGNQQEAYDTGFTSWCCMSFPKPNPQVNEAKLTGILTVLRGSTQVVAAQILFLTALRISLFMQEALTADDTWLAITHLTHFGAEGYLLTLSERHWYTYMGYLKTLATSGVQAMQNSHVLHQVLDAIWTVI